MEGGREGGRERGGRDGGKNQDTPQLIAICYISTCIYQNTKKMRQKKRKALAHLCGDHGSGDVNGDNSPCPATPSTAPKTHPYHHSNNTHMYVQYMYEY